MKNIHIIPTEKPSRLALQLNNNDNYNLQLSEQISDWTFNWQKQNISITNNEDINENDYIITKDGRLVQVSYLLSKDLEGASKVILTTDQDLIKDGVQSIPDEFLEWFVKNPSCEEVDTDWIERRIGEYNGNGYVPKYLKTYLTMIPKEEHKGKALSEQEVMDNRSSAYNFIEFDSQEIQPEQIWNAEKKEGIKKLIQKHKLIDMMEQDEQLGLYQETLEECFLANIKNVLQFGNDAQAIRFMEKYFEAKKEQERSYSEAEVYTILMKFFLEEDRKRMVNPMMVEKWFEQFKKK